MDEEYYDEEIPYQDPDEIEPSGVYSGLVGLSLFSTSMDLRVQAMNLSVVDEFIMGLEYDFLRLKLVEGKDTGLSVLLSAQSQMWVFAAYELMRTWREKALGYQRAASSGGLALKLQSLEEKREEMPYENQTLQVRIDEVKLLLDRPALLNDVVSDLKRTEMLFLQMELLRVFLAKHQMRKATNAAVLAPTYGYMNRWCGSLEYQINNGMDVICNLSRRDIADGIRSIPNMTVPSDESLQSFKSAMRGRSA